MSRPLNILFPYTGSSVGGSHMSSWMLGRALIARGHRVTFGLHQPGGALETFLTDRGETCTALPDVAPPKLRALWRQWPARRRVRRHLAGVLEQGGWDIVHSHDMRNHLIWAAATEGSGVPHVWHQRTPASGRHMTTWGTRAAAFIAVSEFTRNSLPKGLRGQARMIYNPFEPQETASAAARARMAQALDVAPETAVVGFVGNFSDRKRPELFVEIASKVHAQTQAPVAFAMFGAANEPHATAVRARATELGLPLHIMGQRAPFAPWMAGLSVLVAPARQEALGRTLIEAGFAGVPVVATDEGGTPEIITNRETGHLIPPDDAAGFADAVLAVLSDPTKTNRLTKAAQTQVAARFSLDSHVHQIEELYAGLCP